LNNTLEDIERVHDDGLTFMEAAKRLFPDRNGSQNPDGSMMGWSVWKFHSILHKAMELLLYYSMDGQRMSVPRVEKVRIRSYSSST